VLCDDGIAAMQRRLWDSLDVTHRRYSPNHPAAGAISAFYRFVDEQIGELLELIDDDTVIAVVSACGAQSLDGELALNDWLIAQGELTLIAPPARPAHLDNVVVDWERTRAWAAADGAIYLNVVGREPQGIVPAAQIEPVCASLAERLRGLSSPHAARETRDSGPAVEVYRPAALYGTTYGIAPDLLAVCTQPGWRPTASVGYGKTWTSTRETAMDAACESPAGFFVVYDPHNLGGGRVLEEAAIYDIVPTLLALLGEPSPPRSRGRVLPGFEH